MLLGICNASPIWVILPNVWVVLPDVWVVLPDVWVVLAQRLGGITQNWAVFALKRGKFALF